MRAKGLGQGLVCTLLMACSGQTIESGSGGTAGTSTGGTAGTSMGGTAGTSMGGTAGSAVDAAATGGIGGAGGTAGSAVDAAATGGIGGAGGAAGSAGAGGGTLEYAASVADCVNVADPDPDQCEMLTGPNLMSVDGIDSQTAQPNNAYLRFDLDDALEGKTVTGLRLVLRTGMNINASSDQSGEIWQVESFERSDLFVATPATVGASPLAQSMGSTDPEAIPANAYVSWELSPTLVGPNTSLFFGVLPVSNDGVDYFNAKGPIPPTLHVDFE